MENQDDRKSALSLPCRTERVICGTEQVPVPAIGKNLAEPCSPRVLATELRRKQHALSRADRGIHDNMIQILQPKGRFNPAMAPKLLRRQMRNLSPRQ